MLDLVEVDSAALLRAQVAHVPDRHGLIAAEVGSDLIRKKSIHLLLRGVLGAEGRRGDLDILSSLNLLAVVLENTTHC